MEIPQLHHETFRIPKTTSNKEINSIISTFSSKKRYASLIDHVEKGNIPFKDKTACLKSLLMTNDDNILVRVEKFMIEAIQQDFLDSQNKFYLIEQFGDLTNAMMTKRTNLWITHSMSELHWILFNTEIPIRFKIQSAQYMMRHGETFRKDAIYDELFRVGANFRELTFLQMADLADLFINYVKEQRDEAERRAEEIRARGLVIIRHLQGVEEAVRNQRRRVTDRVQRTIYTDSQNVHDSAINENIKCVILQLHNEEITYKTENPDTTHETDIDVIDRIGNILIHEKMYDDKIRRSLERITTDFAFFTKRKFRLRNILALVWKRLERLEGEHFKNALENLAFELRDMSGTCSTGHMSRIVNVLSSIPVDVGGMVVVNITWEQQIASNISGRVNALMRDIPNEEVRGDVVNAMISEGEERLAYTEFLKSIKDSVYNEMFKEFNPLFEEMEMDVNIFKSLYNRNYPK